MTNPRFEVSGFGVYGNDTDVMGSKKLLISGRPVHPVNEQVPLNRGAVAKVNWVELLIRGVPMPGDPFKSVSAAIAWPKRSKKMPPPTRRELLPGPPKIDLNKPL